MKQTQTQSTKTGHRRSTLGNEFDMGLRGRIDGTLPVVCLSGAVGGIAALQKFLVAMPAGSGMAFVVILNHSPRHATTLAKMLQRSTAMPVVAVTDGVTVEANSVYMMPPGKLLASVDGHLSLADAQESLRKHEVVDHFFRTLAQAHGAQAVAVVLSGAGADGTLGLKQIKECGGLTIAQDPTEAEHPDMPRSAIATGAVDWILPVREMPAKLIAHVTQLETLKQREHAAARLAAIVESSSDAIIGKDLRGIVTSWNAGAEMVFGYAATEMIGWPMTRLIPLDRQDEEVEILRRVGAGGTIKSFDTVRLRKDGGTIPISATISPIKDAAGNIIGCSKIARDISEAKRAEVSLLASEQRMRLATEATQVGIWEWDLSTNRIKWDAEMFRIYGIAPTPDGFVGYNDWREAVLPEDLMENEAILQRTVRECEHSERTFRIRRRHDGECRMIASVETARTNAQGQAEWVVGTNLDVTERNQLETQLRARQEQLDFALAAADLGQWSLDLADHTAHRTLRHDQIFGYDTLLPVWTYEMFLEHVVPADRAAVNADFQKSVATSSDWAVECRICRADGRVRHIASRGRIHRDAGGQVAQMLGLIGDITDHRLAEERRAFQFRLAEALRPISDSTEAQTQASRLLGEHLGANRVAYFEIYGDEYVIERDYAVAIPTLAGRYPLASFGKELLADLLAGRTVIEADATTEPHRPPSARAAFAAIQVKGHVDVPMVKDGRFVGGMTVHVSDRRDWTPQEVELIEDTAERTWAAVDRARIEAALRKSETGYRALVENQSELVCRFRPDGTILFANHAYAQSMGTSMEALEGSNFWPNISVADRVFVKSMMEKLTPDTPELRIENRVLTDDGERWMLWSNRALSFDAHGSLLEAQSTGVDITDRKKAESELQETHRRKDEFLATLAHELRSPLAPIRNCLQVIRKVGPDPKVEQALSMIERQFTSMTRLVDDLLDVGRLTTGKLVLRKEPIELRKVIAAALETSSPVIEQHGHVPSVVVPDEPLFVDGDFIRLAQVISNLLINAAKYTRRGGHIHLSVARNDATAVLTVADDGIGISKDMLEAVFGMFTQVDRAIDKTSGGLGVGLSLVKCLVEMHGGTVEARSEGEGRGSAFTLRLPLTTTAVITSEPNQSLATGANRNSPLRILIVDDNEDSADSLGELLELMGNKVLTAYDGESGVQSGRAFCPDVVVCDIGMPKLNGYDTARNIRSEDWGKSAVLVALTGYGQAEDMQKSASAGFDQHLVKPVDVDVLTALLVRLKSDRAKVSP